MVDMSFEPKAIHEKIIATIDDLGRFNRRAPISTTMIADHMGWEKNERLLRFELAKLEQAGLIHRPDGERSGWKLVDLDSISSTDNAPLKADQGREMARPSITLQRAIDLFLQVERRPKTNEYYRVVLGRMARFFDPARSVDSITVSDILAYKATLTGRKAVSISTYLVVIKGLFTFCVEAGFITESPCNAVKLPKVTRPSVKDKAITPDDLAILIDRLKYEPRNLAIVLFLADTACRVGGCASLTIERLDLPNRTAMLSEKGGKEQRVFFGERTAAALEDWLKYRRDPLNTGAVFVSESGQPMKTGGIADVIRRRSKQVCSREYGPHSIRHAVAEAMSHHYPVSTVQRKLGHSSPLVTLNSYYPDNDNAAREASAEMPLAPLVKKQRPGEQSKIIRLGRVSGGRP